MAGKKDAEILALEAVHSALKNLDADARAKVLTSVAALLEIPGMLLSSKVMPASQPINPPRPTGLALAVETKNRPTSLIEYLQQISPGSNSQYITSFAVYREKYEGMARFSRNDLEAYFSKAKLKPPGNFIRDYNEAVKKGWIHDDGSDSYVTTKGIEMIEAGFPKETHRPPIQKKKHKKKKNAR